MIKTNGIDLTDDEIERLFNLVDDDKSGCLSFDEFE
jgi:Ca2+-binding EF-hand superfamily protein